ncbi:hypothetical protein ILUMI_13451 [Ignelater luminosus]|uniref:HTH psq-type domain-containing protein n=1 Tax=Ignelater luminosus TaxID=2038154 RepID=A0A8K0GBZ2_IGNLU|nr:hypothetical protein ILUMI_13451 [Ignelater luminosus]
MVRTYKRKLGTRNYKTYTEAQLEEALQKIADGQLFMRPAVTEYNIPFGTLNKNFHGRHTRTDGEQLALSTAKEAAPIDAAVRTSGGQVKKVAQRLASNINKSRSAISREAMETYFANLKQTLEGIRNGPDIPRLMNDQAFENALSDLELMT